MNLDVRADHLAMIQAVLRHHVPDREVWAFGSRVKGSARPTSDLDLCILGETSVGFTVLGRLMDGFSESNVPYKVDVIEWATIGPEFRDVVCEEKVVLHRPGDDRS